LNVLPATISVQPNGASPVPIPIPAGSVTNCSTGGSPANGPAPGTTYGCTTTVIHGGGAGSVNPLHGALATSGSTITYTPNGSFTGFDTFTVQVQGVNTDGTTALNSGNITVTVGQTVPALGTFGMLLLCSLLLVFGARFALKHSAAQSR
jgi:hypothetical protein